MTREEKIWIAAMVDTEGCIFIHKRKAGQSNGQGYRRKNDSYGPGLEISNTHKVMIDRVTDITKRGSVCVDQPGKGRRKQALYRWNLRTVECKELLAEIYPFLIAKKRQARIAIGCPSSGHEASLAHKSLIALHRGGVPSIDFPPPLNEPKE